MGITFLRRRPVEFVLLLSFAAAGGWHCTARTSAIARTAQAAAADEDRTHSVLGIHPERTGLLLNGRPFQVVGLRCSNALISDEKTRQLINNLDRFASYGVNTISVFFQGSRFGDIKGYREDGSLDLAYARRMARIIEAADARGMVILVGCLYYGGSRARWESWGQVEAERAVAHTIRWLKENDYRNVFVDVNNEHMAKFDDAKLIAAGKAVDPRCVIGTSGRRTPLNADLSLHHGGVVPGKPYVKSEGTMSRYWGAYSKRKGHPHRGLHGEAEAGGREPNFTVSRPGPRLHVRVDVAPRHSPAPRTGRDGHRGRSRHPLVAGARPVDRRALRRRRKRGSMGSVRGRD